MIMKLLKISKRKLILPLVALFAIGGIIAVTTQFALAFTSPNQVQTNLDGCRFFTGLTLPDSLGNYICPDSAYVSGNLGKGWNELDLVPHRLTTQVGNQASATTDYNLIIAADNKINGRTGFDAISIPVVNTAKSDASCTISAEGQLTTNQISGGTDLSIYRIIHIHQAKGTTCVFDYTERLALGSHLYPGSSLQSYLFESVDFKTGKKTVSIPVTDVLPQGLSKDMLATEGGNYSWNITKSPNAANLNFTNTCDPSLPRSQGVQIQVTWTKQPTVPGKINITTHVIATNPSAREVTITVNDKIYGGTTPVGPILSEGTSAPFDVPANTTTTVYTHTATLDPGQTYLNDVATASYIDKVTQIIIPETTTATKTAAVQFNYSNTSAIINDLESITGTGLQFSADSFSPITAGSFDDGYIPGTHTTGPVSWTSISQTVSSSAIFTKTVFIADGGFQSSGSLHDQASLTTSSSLITTTANVGVSVDARVSLVISKTIDRPLGEGISKDFTFGIKDSQGITIETRTVTFSGSETSKTETITNLLPGIYTVSERPVEGWVTGSDQTADINLPKCTETVTFHNIGARDLTVSKDAHPSFKRTYQWGITKSVDRNEADIPLGSINPTFNYTATVTHDAGIDNSWLVTGTITITNSNAYPVTGVNVADRIYNTGPFVVDPNTSCTVDGGASATVPANSSLKLPYTCTYSAAPGESAQINAVTATWPSYGSPNTVAANIANVDWSATTPQLVNSSVTVNDNLYGSLGTVSYTDPSSKTLPFTLTHAGVAGTCKDYTNTATINETGQNSSKTVKVCVGKDLTVSKTANPSFTRTYSWGIKKDVDKTKINIPNGGSATFTYTVDITHNAGVDSSWVITGSITITNPNDWEDIGADVSDAVNNGGACLVEGKLHDTVSVPKSGSVKVDYKCMYFLPPTSIDGLNTATATWIQDTYHTPTGSASGNASFAFTTPTKIVDGSVTVSDNPYGNLGSVTYEDKALITFTYDQTFNGTPGTCVHYNNTATFTTNTTQTTGSADKSVEVCVGVDLTVTKSVTAGFTRTYTWGIQKNVDETQINTAEGGTATFNYSVDVTHDSGADSGWQVTGVITVTNPNDWEAFTFNVVDTISNGGSCTIAGGGTGITVLAGAKANLSYTCTFLTPPTATTGTNLVTVSWDKDIYFTPTGSASKSVDFNFSSPVIVLDGSVTVTDSLGGVLGTVSYTNPSPKSLKYSKSIGGVAGTCTNYDNTATFTTSDTHTTGSSSKTVTVCVGKNLTVAKTANPSFTRSYNWGIQKNVDKTQINIADGGTATFEYSVDITHTTGVDGGWQVTGVITVTNPNDWEDITANSVEDVTNNGGACIVTDNTNVLVPKSGSKILTYTCTYASAPASPSGKNTATAYWNKSAYFTPDASSSGPQDFAFTDPSSVIDGSVTVNDSQAGNLGTVYYTDPSPKTITYSKGYTGVGGTCTNYDNTAIIETNDTKTTGSASKTVKVCVGSDLTVIKTANPSFNRAYTWDITKTADHNQINIAEGEAATFNYTVDVHQTGFNDASYLVTGTITIHNPNDWEDISGINVTDAVDNGGDCTVTGGSNLTLAKGASIELKYSCTYAGDPDPINGVNTATASWDKTAFFTPNGSASGDATFTFDTPKGTTNKTITVSDSYGGTLGTLTATDEQPFASGSFKYARTESGSAGTCTSYDNTATIVETNQMANKTVTLCVGKDLVVTKTATPSFTRTYIWGITKDVDETQVNMADGGTATFNYTVDVTHDNGVDSGWKVTGKITVTNPNDWEDIIADITDEINNGGDCTVENGIGVSIPKGGSVTRNYTCVYDPPPTEVSGENTATATWDKAAYATPGSSAQGQAKVNFSGVEPTLVNSSVTVSDSLYGSLGTVSYTDPSPIEFKYSKNFKGVGGKCTDYTNTARLVETDQYASKTVTVCVGIDLVVSKTANASFTRTFEWKIIKNVDKTQVTLPGGSATFNYTVIVTELGFTDTGWSVKGKITVTNPNNWEDITANVTDAVDNGGTCTVSGGTGVVIPKNGSKELNYTCSYASGPSPASGTNTVTVNWDQAAAFTPTGSTYNTAAFAFNESAANNENKTITVTDTFNGVTTTLGTATAVTSQPFTTKTFTYSHTVPAPFGCLSYKNTAKIVETGQTASQTVTVCGPTDTGALTIGFWQNKNGQGIITRTSEPGGICSLTSWLRQYAPYQDLDASSSCSDAAKYVYNTIKAANAGGPAMNAMLKAQMLATALNVYYSSPALGGNQIGAPQPIGGLTIDLVHVCGNSSDSCIDVSAAFGGASSMTVSQMLAYASGQSNAGGSVWYGNNKAMQGLAKDVFDAINNETATVNP